MEMVGFKSFNGDLTNAYGMKFEVGKTYTIDGELEFGLKGNGFHFCKNLEDTLKFFDEDRVIAKVVGSEELLKRDDEKQDFFDMYVARNLFVERVLSREEIIGMVLSYKNPDRVIRFIIFFPLTEEEKVLFRIRFKDNIKILCAISYYQDNDKEAYARQYMKR